MFIMSIMSTMSTTTSTPKKMIQSSIQSYMVNKQPKTVYGYNEKTNNWHCISCGDNMGPNNPRQLCGKFICHNSYK